MKKSTHKNELHAKHGEALLEIQELKEKLASVPNEPAPATELPDAGTLLNRLRDKRPRWKLDYKDAQMILNLLNG